MNEQAGFTLRGRNPDVLTCIANLSNDEVFTPPDFANQMLDVLAANWASRNNGANIWQDSSVTFLDPFTKSGVFLREITKRLVIGLVEEIPDLQERVDHILTRQVFGIGITTLTTFLARRSLYCSKFANGEHSVANGFSTEAGNIWFERVEHSWRDGRCVFCGAGQGRLGRGQDFETYAYALIHTDDVRTRLSEIFGGDMQFDVIIGNPPYQIEADDSGQNVLPIYNKFVAQAKELEPRFLMMIIPARWMAGGKGLDEFRSTMLGDKRIRTLMDYPNASEAFPGVDIKGGVCYFLWDRDTKGSCAVTTFRGDEQIGPIERQLDEYDAFVRDSRALEILRRVLDFGEPSLADMVSPRDPFGPALSSNFKGFHTSPREGSLRLYMNQSAKRGETWVEPGLVTKNQQLVGVLKVLMPKAGPGNSGGHVIPDMVLSRPVIAEPGSVCTLSHVVIGPVSSKIEAESLASYLRTRFARFMVSLRKTSQDAPRTVYTWVPQQKWDHAWTDAELFERYGINSAEQEYIASMIRPMEAAGE